MHTAGGLEAASKLAHHRPIAIQKLPTTRAGAHVQPVASRQRGDGTVHPVVRMSIPRKAQEDVAQAQPHVPAGEFRCWPMEINICLALKDMPHCRWPPS